MVKKILFLLLTAIVTIFNSAAFGEDVDMLKDKFYMGLAEIVEQNMDNPDKCLNGVNSYYEENRDTVKKIREWSDVPQAQVTSSYNEFRSISDSEIKDYQDEANYANQSRPQVTDGLTRYKEALGVFMQKHIIEGLQIIAKAKLLSR